jgi:hypothetical protein
MAVHPVGIGVLRLFLVIAVTVLLIGLSLLLWRQQPRLRWAPIGVLLAALVFLILPGRAVDRQRLQAAYVESLSGWKRIRGRAK